VRIFLEVFYKKFFLYLIKILLMRAFITLRIRNYELSTCCNN